MDSWDAFFFEEIHRRHIRFLLNKVEEDFTKDTIYPPHDKILSAFNKTPYDKVKAVIVGQDPYHNPNQAMGMSFSVPSSCPLPPSLVNIFKEYQEDLSYPLPQSGDLTKWAENGVLLLNSVLTVKYGKAFSCAYDEYKMLFNDVIRFLNRREKKMVFILWGSAAQSCSPLIDASYHGIVASAHPSPLSAYAGFFHSHPFTKTNQFLNSQGLESVDWKLD